MKHVWTTGLLSAICMWDHLITQCDNYLTMKFGLTPTSAVLRKLTMCSKVRYEIYKC